MAKDLLTASDVSMVFGGLKAIVDFNVHIRTGELLGLIGPNGAGKTTAFNLFTGRYGIRPPSLHPQQAVLLKAVALS